MGVIFNINVLELISNQIHFLFGSHCRWKSFMIFLLKNKIYASKSVTCLCDPEVFPNGLLYGTERRCLIHKIHPVVMVFSKHMRSLCTQETKMSDLLWI